MHELLVKFLTHANVDFMLTFDLWMPMELCDQMKWYTNELKRNEMELKIKIGG